MQRYLWYRGFAICMVGALIGTVGFSVIAIKNAKEPPSKTVKSIEAIVMGDRSGSMAFVDVRRSMLHIDRRAVGLACTNDGLSEVILELDGIFYATGGAALQRLKDGTKFYLLTSSERIVPLTDDGPGEDQSWLRHNWTTFRDRAKEICPGAWPTSNLIEDTLRRMRAGKETYLSNLSRYEFGK